MADSDFQELATLSSASKRRNKASMDFARALSEADENIIGIQANFKEKKTAFMQRAGEIAEESDRITLQQSRAIADPFHDLKVMFTDERSVSDLAADQNFQQNRMNTLMHENQQVVYENSYALGQVQQTLTELENRRRFASEDIQSINAQTAGKVAKRGLNAVRRSDTIQAMSFNQLLVAESQVKTGKRTDIFDWEVEAQLRLWRQAGKNNKSGTSRLKLMEGYMEFLPSEDVQNAVRNGKGMTLETPDGVLQYTPEQVVKALGIQNKQRTERVKTDLDASVNTVDDQVQRDIFQDSMLNYGRTFGVDLFKLVPDPNDSTQQIPVLDLQALPVGEPEELAELQRLDETIREMEMRQVGESDGTFLSEESSASGMRQMDITERLAETRVRRQTVLANLTKLIITDSQEQYSTDGAKKTVEQFIRKSRVTPSNHSAEALTEVLVSDASLQSGLTSESNGWDRTAFSIQSTMLDNQKTASAGVSDTILNAIGGGDDISKEEQQFAMFKMVAGKDNKKAVDIYLESLHKTDAAGVNVHQKTLFRRWNTQMMNLGLGRLLADHANEPATEQAIRSVMEGDRVKMAFMNDKAGAKKLFYALDRASSLMHKQGSLPAEKNLATELEALLTSPVFANSQPVRSMTTPRDHTSALMAANLFKNKQHGIFTTLYSSQIQALHMEDLEAYNLEQLTQDMLTKKYREKGTAITDELYFDMLEKASLVIQKQIEIKRQKAN